MMTRQSNSDGCPQATAITVGTFDGLHRGHIAVLSSLRDESARGGLRPVVVTFPNHPLDIIAPERAPKQVMSPEEKSERLRQYGVEIIMQPFTREMMGQSARDWMRHLRDDLHARLIVIGYDNTFGSDGRSLSSDDYRAIGHDLGLEVIIPPVVEGCSSSAVRRAVKEGNIEEANNILGYPFTLSGRVIKGDQIGRTIGFPTANLQLPDPDRQLLPPFGAYVARAILPDGRSFGAITNIGVRPSVTSDPRLRIETHILDFCEDLYGQGLSIQLLRMLRRECRFPSIEALKEAIARDKADAISYLRNL